MFQGLFESRMMSLSHVTSLYFGGRGEAAKKRIQQLKASEYIGERPRQPYHPSLLFLKAKGFRVLSEGGYLSGYPAPSWEHFRKRVWISELTLRHELAVMDAKVAFVSRLQGVEGIEVAEFSTWPMLYQFYVPGERGGKEVLMKPDSFIRVHETDGEEGMLEHAFFLELDRGTEPQKVLTQKASCYRGYYQSGRFAERMGGQAEAYKDYPFIVLMVFKNAERRNNTAVALLQNDPPIKRQTWLTTFAELEKDPLGAIWARPADYLEATEGTAFDPLKVSQEQVYRRNTDREHFVESAIGKQRLFPSAESG